VVQGMVFLLHRFKAGCGGRLGSYKWGINRQDVHITMHFYALLLMLYSYFAAKGTFKSCISGNKLSISTLGFRQLARKASPSQKQALARVSVARQS